MLYRLPRAAWARLKWQASIGLVAGALTLALARPVSVLAAIAVGFAAFALATVAADLLRGGRSLAAAERRALLGAVWRNAWRARRHYGALLAHVGVAVATVGLAAAGLFRQHSMVTMEPGDVDWYAAAYQALENTAMRKLRPQPKTAAARAAARKKIDAKIDAMFAGIARNSQIISGHTTQATLLAAGQFAVCVSCHAQSIEALQKRGAPLSFRQFAAPKIIRAQGVAIAYRLQHPNAALLFYDWMLRKDGGQKALLDGGANPARPDMPDPELRGGQQFRLNLRPVVSNFKFWADKYERVIQLGSKG